MEARVPKSTLLLQILYSVCAGLYTPAPTTIPAGTDQSECGLHVEPAELMVRFGDSVSVNCFNSQEAWLGWEGLQEPVDPVMGASLPWTEESLSSWDMEPKCYALTEVGQCALNVSLTVYQPPEAVSLSFRDQGAEVEELPLVEDHLYSLHCEVEAVAPARLLTVTFYRNRTELGSRRGQSPLKTPVNQSLSLDYTVSREDHGAHFYCEARLELGTGGPQPPLVVSSHNITATVHFSEEQVEAPPTHSSREHAGRPTVFAQSQRGQRQQPEETAARQRPEETPPKGAGWAPGANTLVTLTLLLLYFTQWL